MNVLFSSVQNRRASFAFAAVVALCSSVSWAVQTNAEARASASAEVVSDTARPPERWCRSGAFLDAIKLMNATSRSLESLERSDAAIAKAELGAMLAIAIKQASEEYHCVKGTLVFGYDASYASTVKRAAAHARAAKLSPDTLRIANELIATIEASGAPNSEKNSGLTIF